MSKFYIASGATKPIPSIQQRCVSLQHLIWSLTLIDQSALIAGKPREATTNDEDSELINHASSPHLINCMVDWISAE